MSRIEVLLVDDHTVVLQTLARALAAAPDIEVVGTARTAADACSMAETLQPDVALVDVTLPDGNGIAVARSIQHASGSTRVLMLTGNTDVSLLAKAMAAGARGYLIKDASLEEVLDAIRRAHEGHVVVPERVAGQLSVEAPATGPGLDLTPRELDVLALMSEGADPRAIGKTLGISWHTARSYIKNVLVKVGAHSQLEAVATARRLGILKSDESSR